MSLPYTADTETGELATDPHFGAANPALDSGGSGLYTTAADYAKFLQALLKASVGDGGLLKRETFDEMLRPQLIEKQKSWFDFIKGLKFGQGMVSDFEPEIPLDHGISGVINTADSPGKRKRSSMMWAGKANGHWFIDRESGIAATFVTCILPYPDAVVNRPWDALERAAYSDLLRYIAVVKDLASSIRMTDPSHLGPRLWGQEKAISIDRQRHCSQASTSVDSCCLGLRARATSHVADQRVASFPQGFTRLVQLGRVYMYTPCFRIVKSRRQNFLRISLLCL